MSRIEIPIPNERLADFCRRRKISELRLFGSALRADFRPDSDLDLLVSFTSDADWSLLDHVAMEEGNCDPGDSFAPSDSGPWVFPDLKNR